MATFYAPEERDPIEAIYGQHNDVKQSPYIVSIIDSLPYVSAILNNKRQIIYSNKAFRDMLGGESLEEWLGLRPGEVVNCIHATENNGGCGTARSCKYCGAVNTVLKAQQTNTYQKGEMNILTKKDNRIMSLEMEVTVSPLKISDETYYVVSFVDTSSSKKQALLDKIFFHDIINKLGSLRGFIELLNSDKHNEMDHDKITNTLHEISEEIIEELQSQHKITMAENKELLINLEPVKIEKIVADTVKYMQRHSVAYKKKIVINEPVPFIQTETDVLLLKRILINLIKNALEASPSNGVVDLSITSLADTYEIKVHNTGVISEEAQHQIFHRSFSTKGSGRGLGTYSIKMLTENYLQGRVDFESTSEKGTIFRIIFPIVMK